MKLAKLLAASILTAFVSLGCGGAETEDLASSPVEETAAEETAADGTVSALACPSWRPTATISCGTDANAYCAGVGGWSALCVSGCFWSGNYRVKNVWCNY
jgi:hypothetical protein